MHTFRPLPASRLLATVLLAAAARAGAAPSPALAATPPAPVAVTTVEGISEYRLANGLQ
ncbi:MAG: hypothetical protein RLZZ451_1535, partial [Pseudomonadota bacterium]